MHNIFYKIDMNTALLQTLKPIYKMSMLTPYEQLFIQTFHYNGNLITEKGTGEQGPLFQLAMDTVLTPEIGAIPTPHPYQLQLSHNIHHYLTELIVFSEEINIISHTIVILTYLNNFIRLNYHDLLDSNHTMFYTLIYKLLVIYSYPLQLTSTRYCK